MERRSTRGPIEIVPGDQRLGGGTAGFGTGRHLQTPSIRAIRQESPPVDVAVIVDSRTAAETSGERGVSVLCTVRAGTGHPRTRSCADGNVDLIGLAERRPARFSGRRVPGRWAGSFRRHVLHRDGGCTVEGCPFRRSGSSQAISTHVDPAGHHGRTPRGPMQVHGPSITPGLLRRYQAGSCLRTAAEGTSDP